MEFQCFEVNPEDDSKDITGCPNDDKPSTGMLASSVLLLILIMFSVFWLFWLSCQYFPSDWLIVLKNAYDFLGLVYCFIVL